MDEVGDEEEKGGDEGEDESKDGGEDEAEEGSEGDEEAHYWLAGKPWSD